MHYEINGLVPLSRIFSVAELSTTSRLPIESYSVSQNTLDNVFVGFVKHQGEMQKQNESSRKLVTRIESDAPLDDSFVFSGDTEMRNLSPGETGNTGRDGILAFLDDGAELV